MGILDDILKRTIRKQAREVTPDDPVAKAEREATAKANREAAEKAKAEAAEVAEPELKPDTAEAAPIEEPDAAPTVTPEPEPEVPASAISDEEELIAIPKDIFQKQAGDDPALRERYGISETFEEGAVPAVPVKGVHFNMDRIQAPDDVKLFIDEVSTRFQPQFDEYSRGVQTLPDIEERAMASMLNTTTDDVRQLRALKAEDFTRGAFTMVNLATEIKRLAGEAQFGDERAVAALRFAMEEYATVSMHIKGLQTETARTLSAMRISKKATEESGKQLSEIVDQFGGTGYNKRLAQMLAQMDDPQQIGAAVQGARKTTRGDMLWEVYYASLLSSPQTQVVNFATSLAAYHLRGVQWMGAYASNNVRRMLGSETEKLYWNEVLAWWHDVETIKFAAGSAFTALRKGESSGQYTKIDPQIPRSPITAANVRDLAETKLVNEIFPNLLKDGHFTQKAFDLLAEFTVRGPKRVMVAADEFNKGLTYSSRMRMQATHQAMEEGANGAEISARRSELLASPDLLMPGARSEAIDMARELTFQAPLGPLGRNIQNSLFHRFSPEEFGRIGAAVGNAAMVPLRMHVPFFRIAVNLPKFVGRNSPMAAAMPSFWSAIAEGGAKSDLAISQMMLGSAMAYGAWELAANGLITGGGPLDPRMRGQWEELGFQEYSMIIPMDSVAGRALGLTSDMSRSFKRADPFAQMLGVLADYNDVMMYATPDEQSTIETAVAVAFYRNITSRTWMQSMGNLMKGVEGMGRGDTDALDGHLTSLLSSPLVPAGAAWIGRTFDEDEQVRKNTRSEISAIASTELLLPTAGEGDRITADILGFIEQMTNKVKARAPGFGVGLPNKRNFWGEVVPYAPGMLMNTVPFYRRDMKFDQSQLTEIGLDPARWAATPAAEISDSDWPKFIEAVGASGEFVRLGWSPGHHGSRIMGVELTPKERDFYIKAVNDLRPEVGFLADTNTGFELLDYSGMTMRQATKALMKTQAYKDAAEYPEMPGSKAKMINRVISDYRHGDIDDQVEFAGKRIGGADRLLIEGNPEFRARLFASILSATPVEGREAIFEGQ